MFMINILAGSLLDRKRIFPKYSVWRTAEGDNGIQTYATEFANMILNEGFVEFTHILDEKSGWKESKKEVFFEGQITFIGTCSFDGDMFVIRKGQESIIFKGHLNSGYYRKTT